MLDNHGFFSIVKAGMLLLVVGLFLFSTVFVDASSNQTNLTLIILEDNEEKNNSETLKETNTGEKPLTGEDKQNGETRSRFPKTNDTIKLVPIMIGCVIINIIAFVYMFKAIKKKE